MLRSHLAARFSVGARCGGLRADRAGVGRQTGDADCGRAIGG